MYKDFTATKKQGLIDICLQVYGTTELLFQFAKDNGLQIDSDVNTGDILQYDDSLGDYKLLKRIRSGNLNMINPNVSEVPAPTWILETGFWNDFGVWVDSDVWID